ncbi:MAG: ABC transporter substrate-binding protein [Thermoanaerobaculia bacterium]|nr:ABC transporter substrate-binding protein [Thermoanaerobaculia bacterium]
MRLKQALSLLSVTLGLAALGCTGDEVKIGVILPLTGEQSTYGEPIRRGVEVAFAELVTNSAFPYKLDLAILDSEGNPDKAREQLEELFGDGALAVIGGATSGEAKEMVGVADRYDRLLLSPSASNPELSGISSNFYRVVPSDFRQASKMAVFATQTLGIKSIVIFAEAQPFATGIQEVFKHEFERYEGKVLDTLEVQPHAGDISGFVERIQTLKPDAVYLAAYEAGTEAMIHALKKVGFTGRILTTHAFAKPSAIVRTGKDAVDVVLTQSVFEVDSDYAHVKSFVAAYEAKYNEKPDIFAAHGYDAMMVLAAAMKNHPAISSEVLKGIRELQNFQGVTGSIQFDDKGDVQQYPRVYIVRDDLTLNDYDGYVARQKEEILRRMEEIRRQAKSLRQDGDG